MRREERVWDNGDMTDCGALLPCPTHPTEEISAGKTIEAIFRRLEQPYVLGEKRTDRLSDVVKLIESASARPASAWDSLPPVRGEERERVVLSDGRVGVARAYYRIIGTNKQAAYVAFGDGLIEPIPLDRLKRLP